MRNVSMSQGRVTLKIAPEMRCIEVPLSGVMLPSSLIKTTEELYAAIGPWSSYFNPSSGPIDTRIRIFYENGVEIPLSAWEEVVHAGMVVMIELIPTMTDRRWSEPCLDGIPNSITQDSTTQDSTAKFGQAMQTPTSPRPMSPLYKTVGLERYPLSKQFTPGRPGNARVHSLPSISEQSHSVTDEEQHMIPRSVTPLPSPQPRKLLLNRAKARGPEKSERDYFSSRPIQPTLARRWSEPSWISAEEEPAIHSECSQQHVESAMDIDMSGTEDIIAEPKTEVVSWEFQAQTTAIDSSASLFALQPTVTFSSKRKRGYGTDSEDDGEEICRRTVKRTMANYHRRQLHGLLQAV